MQRHPTNEDLKAALRSLYQRYRSLRVKGAKGNFLDVRNARYRGRCVFEIRGTGNAITFEDGVTLENVRVVIKGDGNELYISRGSSWSGTLHLEGRGSKITLGPRCTVSEGGKVYVLAAEGKSVTFGEGCLLANAVGIRSSDSHAVADSAGRVNHAKDVVIGDHVWLGVEAMVLKGVEIGNGSVVGARAVVTRDAPPNVVVAGNPARIVREGVRWCQDLEGFGK